MWPQTQVLPPPPLLRPRGAGPASPAPSLLRLSPHPLHSTAHTKPTDALSAARTCTMSALIAALSLVYRAGVQLVLNKQLIAVLLGSSAGKGQDRMPHGGSWSDGMWFRRKKEGAFQKTEEAGAHLECQWRGSSAHFLVLRL